MKDYQTRVKKNLSLPENYFFQKDQENTIYGFNNLSWFWSYGDNKNQRNIKNKLYKKNTKIKTHPISGAIITRYKGQKDKNITLLSSKKFSKSFTPMDAVYFYKKRHRIENQGFRELK